MIVTNPHQPHPHSMGAPGGTPHHPMMGPGGTPHHPMAGQTTPHHPVPTNGPSPHNNMRDSFTTRSTARSNSADRHSVKTDTLGGASKVITPPATPAKIGGKVMNVRVQMLDDTIQLFQIQGKAAGRVLFDQVSKQLNLMETDYFGLEYMDTHGTMFWLDRDKLMNQQICLPSNDPLLRFTLKFYLPDPSQMEEEYTRYLAALQIKRDLASGQLNCNDNTAALMASYIVQAECGDYMEDDYPDHTYLSMFLFVPGQNPQIEMKIMENHKKHKGISPGEADINLLETARRCELYGAKLHIAQDQDGVAFGLAVVHSGINVFQNNAKIKTFSWAKIRKLSFKRKKFLVKLHPEGYYKENVEFIFAERNQCKNFWKKCVEHHGFFRCLETPTRAREKSRIMSRGSSFRYSGRTQKQIKEHIRENFVKRQSFQRHVRSLNGSTATMGMSVSAQPLLPLADNQLVVPTGKPPAGLNNNNSVPVKTTQQEGGGGGTMQRQLSLQGQEQPRTNNFQELIQSCSSEGDATMTSLSGSFSQPTTTTSTPIHSSVHNHFRLMRDESVDGTLSPVSIKGTSEDETDNTTARRKRLQVDKAYFIFKELLMTERTYKKDLEIINLWFRDEVSKENQLCEPMPLLFSLIDPIYEIHAAFLKEMENRISNWESRNEPSNNHRRVGDLVLKHLNHGTLDHYYRYIDTHIVILEKVQQSLQKNNRFEQVYTDFEMQKVCYIPLTTLLLKPLHRILHYQLILERLLNHYGSENADQPDTNMALSKVRSIIKRLSLNLKESENLVKLMELERDLIGYDTLVQKEREFVREGCLQKLSRKGYQQRIFFLFSDVLLYANRTTTPGLQFRVHGQLSVPDIQVVDSEPRMGAEFCFNVYDGKRALMVAAGSQNDKVQWMEDITETVQFARERGLESPTNKYLSLKSISGSDDGLDRSEISEMRTLEARPAGQRSNSSVHVCWHRNTSVALMDHQRALENQLSGYLLRKFKNSNGWQKLWVVFTNFCLYFYKSFQDDFPLASLPLLGYSVDTPASQDNIDKDFVYKLQFKNHVYFFRAESQFTFDRWLEVLSTATRSPLNISNNRIQ